MKTLLTIAQQNEYLETNWRNRTLKHKWSCRGYGNSKILNNADELLGKAGGCGYDRYGTALGNAMVELFPTEILKLAKRECKGRRRNYKKSESFYGLFYDSTKGRAWVDGGCGSNCMIRILNKIGFSLQKVGSEEHSNNGVDFFTLEPLSQHERKYFN